MLMASMFSGFGGADIAAMLLGFDVAWGIEFDPAIAAVRDKNLGANTIVSPVEEVDYTLLQKVDWLHASPSCRNISNANTKAKETELDIAAAQAVARALHALRPRTFSLEQVYLFRKTNSFKLILAALAELGYAVDWRHLLAADYGTAQARWRLILRAVRGWEGELPPPPKPVPHNGWYGCLRDLVWDLPEVTLAPWQAKRLPEYISESLLFSSNGNHESYGDHHAMASDPALTVTAQTLGRSRAVLVDVAQAGRDATLVDGNDPAMTIQAWHGRRPSHMPISLLIEGRNTSQNFGAHPRDGDLPAMTVSSYDRPSHHPKAVLIKGSDFSGDDGIIMADGDEPSFTIQTRANTHRAALRESPQERIKIVALDIRCLARLQDFPNWYNLDGKRKLMALGVGNAVPARLLSEPVRPLLELLS